MIDQDKSQEAAGGATITVQDPRVTNFQNSILACIGIGIIGACGWLITSVNKLNETMTEVVTTNRFIQKQIEANTADIKENAFRISALERKK
jgi:hypothetical protein